MAATVPIKHVQNGLLFLFLGIASYFSLAALAAIPILEESTVDAEAEFAAFKDELRLPERQFSSKPYSSAAGPFGDIDAVIEDPKLVTSIRHQLEENVALAKRHRQKMLADHQNMFSQWQNKVTRARQSAIVAAQTNVNRTGNYERRQYHGALLAWFDDSLNSADREAQECAAAVGQIDAAIGVWSGVTKRAIQQPDPKFGTLDSFVIWSALMPQCDQHWSFSPLPTRPELGARFGPFRPVAEWLVQTESLSLVGITGLLGFGLLGAAASTIIRESGDRSSDQALVTDLPLVLIRGLTAAVVVFLAIKGGLSIFAQRQADPNPYVLLLTCLIAAVFSEPVWEKARVYLTDLTSDRAIPPPAEAGKSSTPVASPSPQDTMETSAESSVTQPSSGISRGSNE